MSKARTRDELRPEYDLAALGRGVTGKYFRQAAAGTNLVLLEPDVADAFPDAEAVNKALRLLIDVAASNPPPAKRRTSRSSRPRPETVAAKPKRGGVGRGA
jgi:hypothetical protein